MSLMSSLGLEQVEADPNAIPDGKYDGEVYKSEYVLVETKDTVSHVITYKVTEGDYAGAQRQEWFTLGNTPRDANGAFPEKPEDIAAYNGTMTDKNKQWYKKRFVDLGIPEDQVHLTDPASLVGIPVTFGVKRNQGYVNINFVEKREVASTGLAPQGLTVMQGAQSLGTPATQPTEAQPLTGGLI